MEKKYEEIEIYGGQSIDEVVNTLREYRKRNKLVYASFNGKRLYSDVDDINSAYKKITGKTKKRYDSELNKYHLSYEKQKRDHKKAIPKLEKFWVNKGIEILDEKHWDYWEEIVPIRLNDLYQGMELGACLEIISELNKGADFKTAKKIIDGQGHSGTSFNLVLSMVKHFCDKGPAFYRYIKKSLK